MPDGMTGLSLSEMGIAVKKAGNAVKKAGTGALQQAAQQITGQAPNQIPTSKPEPVFETDDSGNPLGFFQTAVKQATGGQSSPSQQQQQRQQNQNKPEPTYFTDDGGNPLDLLGGAVKQVQGSGDNQKKQPSQQSQQQGTFVMPKASSNQLPNETAQQQSGTFDLSSQGFEQDLLKGSAGLNQSAPSGNMALEQELAKQKAEDQQKIEQLRKQLHQMYYDELVKKAEGKDQKKEETVQEKLDREKQEEEEKKAKELEEKKKKEEVPMAVKGRQGAHEGLRKQG